MVISEFEKLQNKVSKMDIDDIYIHICKNIKKYRLIKYNEFKNLHSHKAINPYSTENISALLDYNHTHYKRFESDNDSTKKIPFDKLIKLSVILEKNIEDFLK